MQQIKVVGVGFHKTGISTLGKCLQIMGYNHISLDYNSFLLYKSGNFEALKTIVENYDSFDAWPWPLLYKEIDNWFPDTKFVLTRRLNSEVWFSSLSRHVSRKKKLNKKNIAIENISTVMTTLKKTSHTISMCMKPITRI